ncbi:hypothetical protein [Kutzneria kofuensis]|uniref:Uncharacterized protein n=1 Tax=Kutzneria kofuensis TaxID=103725 RepID=A0A7W9NLN4_9PSEU|nr:hypothetical protein [Kutzneria kofuensis]MBB5896498.1 hypothetical protein [Kutzneria kofuensis]
MSAVAGIDATWLVTHGANAAWRYARSVQPTLADIEAAWRNEDWPLCVEACAQALRGIVVCGYCLNGMKTMPDRTELHLLMAVDESPAAAALRALPRAFVARRQEASDARRTTLDHVATLRASLPIDLPVIRAAGAHVPTLRVTAQVGRWRAERGLGPVDWDRSGL